MAMPALKCPYLAQLTLQQVRASASHILNAGAQSCPVFGQLVRKMSTTNVTAFSFDEIKAVHEKLLRKSRSNKIKIPTSSGESKKRICYSIIIFFVVIISAECEDLLCPFLKSTSITLRRVDMDQDMIQVNRKLGKFERPMVDVANSFEYNTFFDEKIEAKKRDNSYRVFKRVQRKSGLFPKAQEKNNLDDDIDSRTITVWCSNDYLGLGQHPKLKKAVM